MEVFSGAAAFDYLVKSTQALLSLRDERRLNEAVNDLLRQIVELRREAFAIEQEKLALLQRVNALEAEKMAREAGARELERYELKDIGGGARAYMLKPAERGGEPAHWLCPGCYASGKKAMLQFTIRTGRGNAYRCTGCPAQVIVAGEPRWLD